MRRATRAHLAQYRGLGFFVDASEVDDILATDAENRALRAALRGMKKWQQGVQELVPDALWAQVLAALGAKVPDWSGSAVTTELRRRAALAPRPKRGGR